MLFHGAVREVAGGENVRRQHARLAAGAQALGEVDLDEAAVAAAELAERVEGLDHARALGPAAAHAAGERNHGDAAGCERFLAGAAAGLGDLRGLGQVAGADVFDDGVHRQAVLRQANAAGAHVGLDLSVLHGVETVLLQHGLQGMGSVGGLFLAARQQVVEHLLHHAGEIRLIAAGGGEVVEFGAARGGKQAGLGAHQRRDGQGIVAGGHEGALAAQHGGLGAAFVDGEVVDHRLHGEGNGVFQAALGFAHDGLHGAPALRPCAADGRGIPCRRRSCRPASRSPRNRRRTRRARLRSGCGCTGCRPTE